ncbi:MAG: hypothetical protein EBS13_06275 [Verrucomicrobia bacterium]|nr:hypothetical protein [Verrucomicrobiota bacterium]
MFLPLDVRRKISGTNQHCSEDSTRSWVSQVKWCEDLEPENFSFFSCRLIDPLDDNRKEYPSYVYWPHPSTKPGFEQPPCVLELLAPYIPDVQYGQSLLIKSEPKIIRFE